MTADAIRDNEISAAVNNSNSSTELFDFLPSKRGFKLASLNIASLLKHIDELRVLLSNCPLDVLSINETRLDESVGDNEVYIPGYEIIRRDREHNGRFGGGVCFYVRSSINFSLRPDLSIQSLENLCIEIRKPRSKPFLIATWYRPPDSPTDIFTHFETLVGKLDAENVEIYLMGDFNCNFASSQPDNNTALLSNLADVYGLYQLIKDPTRVTCTSSTLIDVIFTNYLDRVVCSGVSHVSLSDHSLVYAFRKISIDPSFKGHSTITYRKFKNFDSASFRSDISRQNWDSVNNYDDSNDMWDVWKSLFFQCVDKHAPLRTKRVRAVKSPWITPQLKKRMHDRNILKLKAIRSKNANDWLKFKKCRNSVNSEIKQAKEQYYKNALLNTEGDPRKTWQIINELTSRKTHNSSVKEIKLDNNSIYDPHELSSTFNDYFSSIGRHLLMTFTIL